MTKQTQPLENEFKGLVEIVKKQIEITLLEVFLLWQLEPPIDWKRVVRVTGEGNFSITIEPYQGTATWINLRKKIDGLKSLCLLEELIHIHQPDLLGYVFHSGGLHLIQETISLVSFWCQAVHNYINLHLSTENAIKRIIAELDDILRTNYVTQEILTPLSGLNLPLDIEPLILRENIVLCRLSLEEISDLASNDISSQSRYDISSRSITTALVITRPVRLQLSVQIIEQKLDFTLFYQEIQDQIDDVLYSLHVLKSGRVGVLANFMTLHPTLLPSMSGTSYAPIVFNPHESMQLNEEEIASFISLYHKIIANKRNDVRIAITRLVDAENRFSPVDSLLDAVIGLEVLLNPNDYSELAFRVALNYAYLGDSCDYRKRYEDVRNIQKTRNGIVHGGLNLKSKDNKIIHEHSTLAKQCLRDAIKHFLFDESFTNNVKIDTEFWLDRIIPAEIVDTTS
ncbi:MAG: hypothetical protein ACK6C7_05550 [Pseudanabaena sp.]|jgi:hypothetical protein